jgi:AI-2 transport protein TqsA
MENQSFIPKTKLSTAFYTMATIALTIFGLIYLDSIIKPFVVAFLIWFIITQLKISLGKIKIRGKSLSPIVGNILSFIIIFLIIYLALELLISDLEGIVAEMPEHLSTLNKTYDESTAFINDPEITKYLQKWINSIDLSGIARNALNSISGIVANLAVVLVYVIFFLLETANRNQKIEKLFPGKGERNNRFFQNMNHFSKTIRTYLWSKTIISLATGVISYFILLILGVDYAFFWSFLIFLLNFIPYIGPLISSLLPAIFAVLISGDPWRFIYVFAAMEGVQIIIGNFIEPKIFGKGSNIGPVTVILALAIWGMIWGITGMILAVPITAVIVILFSQIPSTRNLAILLSEKGNIPDIKN